MAAVRRLGVFALFCLTVLVTLPLRADVVELDNGDRVTGTVVALAGGTLTVDTGWAGTLEIDWAQVARLTTEGEIRLVLNDETEHAGSATPDGAKRIALDDAGTFDLANIVAINPPEIPPVVWSGGVNLGISSSSGNTEAESAYLDAAVTAETARHRFNLTAAVNEASNGGVDSASRRHLGLGYNFLTDSPWYLTANAGFTEDKFQDLDLRSAAGLGVGYQFWKTDRSRLSSEIGLSYVDESFLTAPDADYAAGRWGLDLEHLFADGATFFHNHRLLVSLENSEDLLANTRTGVRFSLFGKLVSTIQFNLDYDDSPAPGREKEDTTYLVTFGYSF